MASVAIAGFFILAIACGVGFGAASAESSDDLALAGAFGFDEATHVATIATASTEFSVSSADTGSSGQLALVAPTSRDISSGFVMVEEREAAEQARIQAESAAAAQRVESKKAMQGVTPDASASASLAVQSTSSTSKKVASRPSSSGDGSKSRAAAVTRASEEKPAKNVINNVEQVENAKTLAELDEYDLPAVEWAVGKKAFVSEWAARIDAYLEGTALEGFGPVFAEAAWENGVDPRWSPAISNTESGNGSHCFLPYNAWGWGDDSWSDWETAIRAHVAGLAEGYGYSVTFEAAQKYCPPNCVHWYNNTISQMALI